MTTGIDQAEQLRTGTDKLTELIEWLVKDVIRGTAIKRMAFVLVLLVLLFNPLSTSVLSPFFHLPHWYPVLFWIITLAWFVATVLVGVLTTPRTKPLAPVSVRAIRGLIPFTGTKADVELFAKLERERDISEVLTAISDPGFRIGYISGDSGSGKTSLVHAGVAPRVELCSPVVVELSDLDPIESIRESLAALLPVEARGGSLADMLANAARSQGKPVLLILDQFEQFFVHCPRPPQRRPFIESLKQWFDARLRIPARILISIRGDFGDRLVEIQKALGYTLAAHQVFRLERFQPDQAVAIIRVLAESGQIPFDESFVRQMVREELASREDGTVSAVDIQVLAWVIAGLPDRQRAFSRESVKMSGGVEGLLERYLQKSLAAIPHLREPATKVLLALIDLNQDARAGALTINEISDRLEGSVSQKILHDALDWLTASGVRLVVSSERNDRKTYQLVHERLIPALKKTAFGILGESEKANEVLNRRVREWLDNGKSRRYLLTWPEWQLVSKQRSFISWGNQQQQKEELLRLTAARWRHRAIAVGVLLLLAVGAAAFGYSPPGQKVIARWELESYLKGDISNKARADVVTELAKSRSLLEQALPVADSITAPVYKASALAALAAAWAQAGTPNRLRPCSSRRARWPTASPLRTPKRAPSRLWLRPGRKRGTPNRLRPCWSRRARWPTASPTPDDKASALEALAAAWAQAGDTKQAAALFEQARQAANSITDPADKASALQALAAAWAQAAAASKDAALLEQARQAANSITDPDCKASALAGSGCGLGASGSGQQRRGPVGAGAPSGQQHYRAGLQGERPGGSGCGLGTSGGYQTGCGPVRAGAPGGQQHHQSGRQSARPRGSGCGLGASGGQQAGCGPVGAGAPGGQQHHRSGLQSERPRGSGCGLGASGGHQTGAALLEQARQVANSITEPDYKASALAALAAAWAQAAAASKDAALLEQARQVANSITDPYAKARALKDLAAARAQAGDTKQAAALFEQAHQVANSIPNQSDKAAALQAIAGELAALGHIRTARQIALQQVDDGQKALTLATVLQRASGDSTEAAEKKDAKGGQR